MMTVLLVDVCRDCRHGQSEHDAIGCRHSFEEHGERFECVCQQYIEV